MSENKKQLPISIKELKVLLAKNKKRLQLEITESKEVLFLLGESTKRKLTKDEQKRIQNQLLDIFKTIPSLAIFMLPGGSILLPLAIKYIPGLLPSAFNKDVDIND